MTVRLIHNATAEVVWTGRFDGSFNEPLALESDIATQTTETIREWVTRSNGLASWALAKVGWRSSRNAHLSAGDLPPHPTASEVAFSEYQRGRVLWRSQTMPSALEAVRCFERAIRADPKFALAYAALADIQAVLLNYNYAPTSELLEAARMYADKAVALNSALPECHAVRGAACQALWQWSEAEKSYRAAIDRQPKFARAHYWLAGMLIQFERFTAAFQEADESLRLDPFDYPGQSNYGYYLWQAGLPVRAAQHLETLLKRVDIMYPHITLGQVYAGLAGSSSEPDATEYFIRSLNHGALVREADLQAAEGVDPGFLKWSDLIFALAHAARKDLATARHFVNRLDVGFNGGKISGSAVAWAYAAIDNRPRALDLLEYGLQHQEREMLYVRVTPLLHRLHPDPRFQRILRKMNLV